MNGVYIPISEFARLIGVSTQAVRTKKGIEAYIKDTKPKTIDIAAAALYDMEINVDNDGNMFVGNVGNALGENIDSVENNKANAESDVDNTMRDIVDMLRGELARKNEMLTTMETRIAEKDATIKELTQKLTELVQKEQEISQNAITALQQRNYIEEHKNILEAEKQGSVVDMLDSGEQQELTTQKKGLFAIFSRKKH
jgi:hypothetical protein|nr:MAG TPA: hypothetical protein [Caudoviricetes sp.]